MRTKLLSLTLNDRGLGFELNGVSLILTGIANFDVSMVKTGIHAGLIRWCIDSYIIDYAMRGGSNPSANTKCDKYVYATL